MNNSWVFTHASGVHREEAGASRLPRTWAWPCVSRSGASDASYTFSSQARPE